MINFAGLGIEEASTKAIAALIKKKCYQLTMAYLDGINQYWMMVKRQSSLVWLV
jgi:hypothetical protein